MGAFVRGGMASEIFAQAEADAAESAARVAALEQIAVTNMRLMLATSVATGALAQGKQWELATDEWGASSTGEIWTAGTPSYYFTGGAASKISGGANIGNMTANGGLAAAFDGVTVQGYVSAAGLTGSGNVTCYVGKDWGAGNTKTVTKFILCASSDIGFSNSDSNAITVKLQGSTDGFVGSIVDLYTDTTVVDSAGLVVTVTGGINASAGYRYHRAVIVEQAGNGTSHTMACAEVEFYETIGAANGVLIPPANVPVSAAPAFVDGFFLWQDNSGSAVLGTDLTVDMSRDNGTTYTAATLENLTSYDGAYSIIKARANVSAQPAGTSMLMRINTFNGKAQRIAAPAIYAE